MKLTIAGVVIGGAVAAAGTAIAQDAPPAPPAVTPEAAALAPLAFTAQQVATGRGLFGGGCAGCHGETLAGLDGGPPLVGDAFAHWYTGPVSALYDFVLNRMPLDAPGTLQPRQALGLVAFILEHNGFVAGDVALPEDPAALALLGFRQ
ncbi:MAG: cytochrome c [Thermomicrobiales bacterium]|nr:cytochrome c [Thermomicrobiales bacterium]